MKKINSSQHIGTESAFNLAWQKDKYRYILLLPAVLAVFVFSYLPFAGISIAFKDFDMIAGFAGSKWVGLENFRELFSSKDIWTIVLRTLWYSTILIFVTFPFPIILALMFDELKSKRYKSIAQTMTYLPHFLSMITVVGIFQSVLSLDGTFNNAMAAIIGEGYVRKNMLLDSKYFLGILFTANLWKEIGWSSVIFLAAIAGVDKSLYEAAELDGCGYMGRIRHVTLPGILGTIIIVLVMNFGNIFNMGFELVYGFQNLYTQKNTDIISTFIYRNGIVSGDYSHSTAFGLTQGLVSVTLVFLANSASKKLFSVSIW